VQLYRYFVSQSSEFFRHNPLCCFSTSVYCYCCCCRHRRLFRYDSVRKLLDTLSYFYLYKKWHIPILRFGTCTTHPIIRNLFTSVADLITLRHPVTICSWGSNPNSVVLQHMCKLKTPYGTATVSNLQNASPYYSVSELCGSAVTVSFSKYLPWQAMHFL
jgi:hypothetical protein